MARKDGAQLFVRPLFQLVIEVSRFDQGFHFIKVIMAKQIDCLLTFVSIFGIIQPLCGGENKNYTQGFLKLNLFALT